MILFFFKNSVIKEIGLIRTNAKIVIYAKQNYDCYLYQLNIQFKDISSNITCQF